MKNIEDRIKQKFDEAFGFCQVDAMVIPQSGNIRNIHTGRKRIIKTIEYVPNYPKLIKIWIMEDGEKYNEETMRHWERAV